MTREKVKNNKIKGRKEISAATSRKLFILAFMAWPVLHWFVFYFLTNINSILMAFQHTIPGTNHVSWTLDNFADIFVKGFSGGEALLKESTINTLTFFVFGFFVIQPLNIIIGYFFYKKMPVYKIFRFMFYLPAIIPSIVMATLFKYIIAPESSGLLATVFAKLGKPFPNLLGTSDYAMKTMLVYNLWTGLTGFLLTSNAMKRVPIEIIESAQLDGIKPLRELVSILVPLVWPTIAVSIIMSVLGIFTSSGPVLVFTKGEYGTYTIAYWLFEKVLTVTNLEYAAAAGLFFTVLGLPILIATKWLTRRVEDVEY